MLWSEQKGFRFESQLYINKFTIRYLDAEFNGFLQICRSSLFLQIKKKTSMLGQLCMCI